MRIAVGGIEHETCGFAAPPSADEATTLMSVARTMKFGEELCTLGDANTIVDGLVRGVRETGHELVPLLWIDGNTSPPVTRQSLENAIEDLLDRLRKALPVDGVLLSLHGAFAADGVDDADGEVLSRVRELVGPTVPVMAVHDLHCNISPVMKQAANVMVVERTYPHVDMAERAMHAARIMARTVSGEVRPTMVVRYLPLLWSAARMIDAEPPMSDAVRKLRELDQRPGVVSASIGVGYQWIDNPTVKSTGHFRSGFAPIAGSIFNVDTASTLSHDFHKLPYTRLGRRMYPIDPEVRWNR